MSDVSEKEASAVRAGLHVLRLRTGSWDPLASALGYECDSLHKIAMAKRPVTAALVLRVARFAKVPVDAVLSGAWLPAGICARCGRAPDDRVVAAPASADSRRRIARATRSEGEFTAAEQRAVRTALRFLRTRVGGWDPLGSALGSDGGAIRKVAVGQRVVTAAVAMRVARLAEVPVEELLAGQWLSARVCPHCGRPPSDFGDEETATSIDLRRDTEPT